MHHQRSPKEAANQGILLDAILSDLKGRVMSTGSGGSHTDTRPTAANVQATKNQVDLEPEPEPEPKPGPSSKAGANQSMFSAPALAASTGVSPVRKQVTMPSPGAPSATPGHDTNHSPATTPRLAISAMADAEETRRLAKIRSISTRPASASPRLNTPSCPSPSKDDDAAQQGAEDAEQARLRRIREIASRPKSARAKLRISPNNTRPAQG